MIQGISGPATLGLAQVLTGARYKQFTIFSELDNLDKRTEVISILQNAASDSETLKAFYSIPDNSSELPDMDGHSELMSMALSKTFSEHGSLEAIIRVLMKKSSDLTHDERKILWWDFAYGPAEMILPRRSQ